MIAQRSLADVTFRVTLDAAPSAPTTQSSPSPISGRLLISLIDDANPNLKGKEPNESPLWEPPQPMFAVNVLDLKAGAIIEVGSGADAVNVTSTAALSGKYRVQARLITNHATSSWRDDGGNFYSDPATFECSKDAKSTVAITLSHITTERAWPAAEAKALGVELVDIRSSLLSDFHKREVRLRAAVVPPLDFDTAAGRSYSAVYEVPGFGGRHFDALAIAQKRNAAAANQSANSREAWHAALAKQVYWIILDPESPNGHTLFADSANNGPCGKALTEELIPAIEARFPKMVAKPESRLLRGHSSGGWSTLWLAITYPQVFGITWSTSPDPVDFRRLQLTDIYGQRSMYVVARSEPSFGPLFGGTAHIPIRLKDFGFSRVGFGDGPQIVGLGSYRRGGKCIMTVEQECTGEDLLAPDNTSGQQWDSWFAAWGPRNPKGHPEALYDPKTGVINHTVADQYKKYDIAEQLRNRPQEIGQLLRERVHLAVGTADNFYLNEAVRLLQIELTKVYKPRGTEAERGYIRFVEGADHGTIFGSKDVVAFPQEMLEYLTRTGLVPSTK